MTRVEHLLICLMEECNEVSQRVSKALRFGLDEIQPDQEFTNAQRMIAELQDLMAIVHMLNQAGVIPDQWLSFPAIKSKELKVEKFLEYSRQCGTLGQ